MRRIALDVMGGDHAPGVELDAAVAAVREAGGRIGVVLVGDEALVSDELARRGVKREPGLQVVHASQVVTMTDAPSSAARAKKDSSMRVCFDLVKNREADALVSAGNSGAMLACGLLVLGRLPGVERPGIVATFPTLRDPCVLCDMGANVDPKPEVLAQFGVLGATYAQVMWGKSRPRVGLLANGEEDSKGTPLTREANVVLRAVASAPGATFDYVGYVEGRDIFSGEIDVVATDGFTGNVVLKTAEGAGQALYQLVKRAFGESARSRIGALLAKPALLALKKKLDWAETGGAPLLGVDGVVVLCHGASTPLAVKNAVFMADRFAERRIAEKVAEAIARGASAWSAA